MQTTKTNDRCLAITTRSGNTTVNPPIHVINNMSNELMDIDDAPKAKSKKLVTGGEFQ